MVGRQKQKRSRVKKRFASAEPNGSVASIRSYGFAHVQCRVMCEASQNLSSFTLRLNRAPDVAAGKALMWFKNVTVSPNISHTNYGTDLILGKAFSIFIFFHFPDSELSVLTELHYYF